MIANRISFDGLCRFLISDATVFDATREKLQILVIKSVMEAENVLTDYITADTNVGNSRQVTVVAEQDGNVTFDDLTDVLVGNDDFQTKLPSKEATDTMQFSDMREPRQLKRARMSYSKSTRDLINGGKAGGPVDRDSNTPRRKREKQNRNQIFERSFCY